MTLGLSNQRRRSYRRRRNIRVMLAIMVVVAAGALGFRFGIYSAERPVVELEDAIGALRTENIELAAGIQERNRMIARLESEKRDLEERYRKDVPSESDREILALATQKLADGVDYERLAFVIGAAQNERRCVDEAATKRFIVRTPLYSGANSSVLFANGAVTVTAEGIAARSETGAVEQWYDPAEPIKVSFTHIGGEVFEIQGKLPLHKSIVVGDTEYRYSVTQGPRSFVYVSGDQCAYP